MSRLFLVAPLLLLFASAPSHSGVYDDYKSLNSTEKRLALRYFWQVRRVKQAAEYARAESSQRYAQLAGQDDTRDAYRHALWNGSMTRRLRSERAAERWGNAHEEIPGNPAVRKSMDLFNNARGRELAWSQRTTKRVLFWNRTRLPSDSVIAQTVRTDLAAGGLREIQEQGGVRDPDQGTLVPTR